MKRYVSMWDDGKIERVNLFDLFTMKKHHTLCTDYYKLIKYVVRRRRILCENCQRWRVQELHHMNKKENDNRLCNLRMYCRKCHRDWHHNRKRFDERRVII